MNVDWNGMKLTMIIFPSDQDLLAACLENNSLFLSRAIEPIISSGILCKPSSENSPTASHDDNILISENPSHKHMVLVVSPVIFALFWFQLIFLWRKPVLIRNPFTSSY